MSIDIDHLSVFLRSSQGERVQILNQVSFSIPTGTTVGVVGESGSGKSITALAIMQLLSSPPLEKLAGAIRWKGRNLLTLDKKAIRTIRGREISMIFQEPMTALNPVLTVSQQIREVLAEHQTMSKVDQHQRVLELLEVVGIPSPQKRAQEYPHQLSGGMRQRVMIAIAIACQPQLLIADEPTTALDVTIQAQILEQLKTLQQQFEMGMLFISHDLNVVGYLADTVVVMYAGEVIEMAPVETLFARAAHPYTQALQQSRPQKGVQTFVTIPGQIPSFVNMPKGCRFYERCTQRKSECLHSSPPSYRLSEQHHVRCFLYAAT